MGALQALASKEVRLDTTELVAVCVVAYFATGLALTGYDGAASPLHQKGYVINQSRKMMVLIWFTWPLTSLREIQLMSRFHPRSAFRLFLGVVFLAVGMYFWGRLAFVITDRFIGVFWIDVIVTFVALALTSPILAAIAMPKHGDELGSSNRT